MVTHATGNMAARRLHLYLVNILKMTAKKQYVKYYFDAEYGVPHVVWPDMFELQQQLADKTAADKAALVVDEPVADLVPYVIERVNYGMQGHE